MDEPLLTGLWAVAQLGPRMFLACLKDYKTTDQAKAEDDFKAGKVFHLEPALDYYSPLRQVQQGEQRGIAREPVIVPFEFTTGVTKVLSRLDMICFLDDMSNEDRKIYIGFIASAEKSMQVSRAQRAGIILPDGPMPKTGNA